MSAVGDIDAGEEELFFVIPLDEGHLEFVFEGDEEVDDSFGIGAAVDIVTHEDDVVFWLRIDDLEKLRKGGKAAVNVSDDECSHDVWLSLDSFFEDLNYEKTDCVRILYFPLFCGIPVSIHFIDIGFFEAAAFVFETFFDRGEAVEEFGIGAF